MDFMETYLKPLHIFSSSATYYQPLKKAYPKQVPSKKILPCPGGK